MQWSAGNIMKTGDGIEKTDELPKIVISPSMRVLTGMLITAMIIAGILPWPSYRAGQGRRPGFDVIKIPHAQN
jgi:hypothetical protein